MTLALEIGCGSGFISQELSPAVSRIIATGINPMLSGRPEPEESRS